MLWLVAIGEIVFQVVGVGCSRSNICLLVAPVNVVSVVELHLYLLHGTEAINYFREIGRKRTIHRGVAS